MAWEGIPFLFTHDAATETLHVAFNTLPKIFIESPPDYTNAIITGIVSLVAGIIPASIAIWTFKRNAANVKDERKNQQEFLREDRERQQLFLEADRNKQQESFEQDRKTQIDIAKTNFNMQVLSGNRQAWINTLRDLVADYTVEAPGLIQVTFEYTNAVNFLNSFNKHIEDDSSHLGNSIFEAKYKEASSSFELVQNKLNQRSDKVAVLNSKILMMLNPKEEEYGKVSAIFDEVRRLSAELLKNDTGDLFQSSISSTIVLMKALIILMQDIFKKEWERVKAGV